MLFLELFVLLSKLSGTALSIFFAIWWVKQPSGQKFCKMFSLETMECRVTLSLVILGTLIVWFGSRLKTLWK